MADCGYPPSQLIFDFPSRLLIYTALAIVFTWYAWPAVSRATEPTPNQPPTSTIAELLEQLGSPLYRQRRRAYQQLIQHGDAALPLVQQRCDDPDREIRDRCRRIAKAITADYRARLLGQFQADQLSDAMQLPGWKSLSASMGDSPATRVWLARMLHWNWDLIEAFESDANDANQLVVQEVNRLYEDRNQFSSPPTGDELAVMLMMVNDQAVKLPNHSQSLLLSLLHQLSGGEGIADPWQDRVFRGLTGGLIRRCFDASVAYQSLTLALRHDLKEGLVPATAVFGDRSAPAHVRQYAILTVARFGSAEHVDALEQLLEDKSVCYRRSSAMHNASTMFECQVRDVALASAMHLLSRDPREFGYSSVQRNSYSVFQPHSLGFTGESARQIAFDHWLNFRNQASVNLLQATAE